jgi:hypothetical protein
MDKDKPEKKGATPLGDADPRFVPVVKTFARTPGVSLMQSKSGAMRALMLHGKSFGMSSKGRLLLKLTEERAARLISEGVGKPFSPSAGRVMKGWVEVTAPKANWVALSREAHRLAAASKTSAKARRR